MPKTVMFAASTAPDQTRRLEPRGVQRGTEARVLLRGNLAGLRSVTCSEPRVIVEFADGRIE